MADIDVVFRTGQPTMVLQDPEAVMQSEILNWRMHTAGTEVRSVRIFFQDEAATFFPRAGSPPSTEIKKGVGHGQTIWGQAPTYFTSGGPQSRPDKYTIEAFDQNDKRLDWATLDPTIRTDGP
jgi:hypothetical protein